MMIVDPDFCDHWKTRMLIDLLDFDESAPLYVIRLWSHCQLRRAWVFELTPEALRSLCRFKGDATKFESAMVTAKWVERDGGAIRVLEWEIYNATLVAAWSNGKKGGRPSKLPKQNPSVNPSETHGLTQHEPTGNPAGNRLDRIGLDGIGEEQKSDWSSVAINPETTPDETDPSFLTSRKSPLEERFWAAYPKRTKRNLLEDALNRAIGRLVEKRGMTAESAGEWLILQAMEFAESPAGQDAMAGVDRRTWPANWLDQGGYDDDRKTWLTLNGDAPKPKPNGFHKSDGPKVLPLDARQ